ncbi:hypothetical protein HMPREF1982_01787 [Clostridiales bacterium oral taxon 876 str. F0540]|nr:hypothetical protein HMPREF1982_01787 [Clostridiales bacterium oral taxon 876 str. F0540]
MATIGILGTIHGEDSFREEVGLTLEVMKQAITEFNPDIICGEIRPEDWDKYCNDKSYSGYLGPNEYRRMIIPYCECEGVKFEPIDWFEEDMLSFDYFRNCSQAQKDEYNREIDDINKKVWEIGKKSKLPLNSLEFNEISMELQDFLYSIEPTIHNILWIARNQLMIERIKKVVQNNPDKRILCTAGAHHIYFYYNELKLMNSNLIFPIK